ncbi:MAG: hypothetical protein GAK45_02226 [Pseudomonas citronellolis]|nr:MAG: hypothetical protein GAK45_02226 [Pseudomonas citronellolis]
MFIEREAFFEHLAHYLPLTESSHPQLAVGAWLHALQLQPDRRLDDPLLSERLAALLLERHKPREALALLRNLHQRFPDYPHIPRAYLLAARGFAEGLGQVEPAAKLLAYIRQRYPASPLLDDVERLQQVLERMQVQG